MKRFLLDENGTIQAVEFDFLKTKNMNGEIERYNEGDEDKDIIPVHHITAGPLRVTNILPKSKREKVKVKIPDYPALKKHYSFVKNFELQKEYDQYLCNKINDDSE